MQQIAEVGNARTPEQIKHMQATIAAGTCAFCDIDRAMNPYDIKLTNYWRAMENAWPYPGHMYHLVIPCVEHWTTLSQVPDEAWVDAIQLINALVEKYKIPGGAIILRFGDFKYHAGTLRHLHFQLQVPSLLGQSFATFGKPDVAQTNETIAMLTGEKVFRSQHYEIAPRGEYWFVGKYEKPRPHTLNEFVVGPLKKMTLPMLAKTPAAITELFAKVKNLEMNHELPGGAIVLYFGDGKVNGTEYPVINAKVIVAADTGPVLEVFHPAFNEQQAMRSMKFLYKK